MRFINRINRQLNGYGYNLKEKSYIIGGGLIGAATPIVAARYFVFPKIDLSTPNGPIAELFAWLGSLAINASTMVIEPHMPIPLYTLSAGVGIGALAANHSKQKRIAKKSKIILEQEVEK